MKKLLILFFCCFLLYTCQLKQPELYKEQNIIEVDTLKVEQIKIPTH